MGKMYGQSVGSRYFNLEDYEVFMIGAIDLACMTAYWEDESYHLEKSKETASNEAGAIGSVMEEYRKHSTDR